MTACRMENCTASACAEAGYVFCAACLPPARRYAPVADKPDLVEGAATTARILSQSIIDQGYAATTSNEITRLRSLAKANNDLARMQADEIIRLRAEVERLQCVTDDMVEDAVAYWHDAPESPPAPMAFLDDFMRALLTKVLAARAALEPKP